MANWEQWENDARDLFGLSSTICSGNQFQDPGDAVDRSNPHEAHFRLFVDCKYTEAGSYSVNHKKWTQWFRKGEELGKRAIIAIRLQPMGIPKPVDVVMVGADDFAELLEKARQFEDTPRCPNAGHMCNCTGACRVPVSQRGLVGSLGGSFTLAPTPNQVTAGPDFSGFSL